MFKIKVLADSVIGDGPFPGFSLCVWGEGERGREGERETKRGLDVFICCIRALILL